MAICLQRLRVAFSDLSATSEIVSPGGSGFIRVPSDMSAQYVQVPWFSTVSFYENELSARV